MTIARRRHAVNGVITALLLASAVVLRVGVGGVQAEAPPAGRIAFVRHGDIWVWSNGDAQKVVSDGAAGNPRWSPDGRKLLYVRTGDSYSDLLLWDLAAQSAVALTSNRSSAQPGTEAYANGSAWALDPDWSRSGLIGFVTDASSPDGTLKLWLISDLGAGATPAPQDQPEDNIGSVSLASDGGIAAYTVRAPNKDSVEHTFVALRDLSDGKTYLLLDDAAGVFDPAIAPDNQQVAVAVRSAAGLSDIWLVDRASGRRTQVTANAQATKPAWSPDGRWLAYLRMVDYQFEAWAVPIANGAFGPPQRLFGFGDIDATSGLSWTLK